MSSSTESKKDLTYLRSALIKVPEVSAYFWIIKILATTVGETFADFINRTLGLGLNGTSIVMSLALAIALVIQFRNKGYIPASYWSCVVLTSVTGTLLTDNLTDNLGVSLLVSSAVFFVALCISFAAWFKSEGTLSIHSIDTNRREGFYWVTILLTFALGTATGDLVAERWALGYGWSFWLFAGVIVSISIFYRMKLVGSIFAFWLVYILTRPLGASIGDFLSQEKKIGGIGLGATVTSALFLLAIIAVVTFLSVTKSDVIEPQIDSKLPS